MEQADIDKNIADEELVRNIVKTNNTHLFAILYDRYANVVYNKCLSFSKSTEEAQDLAHDVFVNLFVKLRTFQGKSKFSTWLYSFTYNFCVNYVQRDLKKRKEKFVNTDEMNRYSEELAEIKDEDIFELKSDKLEKALKIIDPDDKMILLMKYQDDFTIKEIKETLEIGESAVKMRLSRAKNRLVEIYKKL
ncbi:RNA polymerase sigma factor [Zhouia spongiae]|uniref:RNA polymerase sigma factor n=1 Tax=Zhouia spongiae TaxID=2202721 RepID=A0ABY3YM92_9FLAO|nr:RNA polymerase sigma factor [Zhouia spongiae]UNY98743.1 RNA polymerase sigma factor [Zhouia spongiae]